MKKFRQPFLLTMGVIVVHLSLFGQDSPDKVYTIRFEGFETLLTKTDSAMLSEIAIIMKGYPHAYLKVVGCPGTENQKVNKAVWDRANNIMIYLITAQGIEADRFVFKYGDENADCKSLSLQFTADSVTTTPPPHPNLWKKNL